MNPQLKIAIDVLGPFLESLEHPVAIIDEEGKFVYYNQYDAEIDEYSAADAIGKYILKLYSNLTEETSTMLRALHFGESFIDQHQIYETRSGKIVDYIHTTLPLYDDNKNVVGAIEIGRDIGRLKNLTNQVLDLSEKLYAKTNQDLTQEEQDTNDIITRNATMKKIINELDLYSITDYPLLVYGETGTGKELFVKRAHSRSRRSGNAFITLNCAAIPDTLLESILFGTVKGAFTGAENRKGLFEIADKGTLFLDELNSMPLSTQAKLLRVLQDGQLMRVGSSVPVKVNVRVMAAMNEDPREAVKNGHLREDLYYRLNVGLVYIPPLRHRKDDIALLAGYFVKKHAQEIGSKIHLIHPAVIKQMEQFDWPGNVRMLENVIRRSMILENPNHVALNVLHLKTDNSPSPFSLENTLTNQAETIKHPEISLENAPLKTMLERFEKDIIIQTLQQYDGNIKQSAAVLGIPRSTLQYKIKKYDIENVIEPE